jgi:hypothetical protein
VGKLDRKWKIAIMIIAISVFAIIIYLNYQEDNDGKLLTRKSIVETFSDEGIKLKFESMDGQSPYIEDEAMLYSIEGSSLKLKLYIYDSISDKMTAYKPILDMYDQWSFTGNEQYISAKNAIICIVMPDPHTIDLSTINLLYTDITDIIFEKLNDGKTKLCTSESENWEAIYKLKYYDHEYSLDGDILHETRASDSFVIKYKNDDLTDKDLIDIEYDYKNIRGSIHEITINQSNRIYVYSNRRETISFPMDEQFNITIHWQGNTESIQVDCSIDGET